MAERKSGYYWIKYRGDKECLYYNQNSKRLIYGAYKLHESDVEFLSETPVTPDSEALAKIQVLEEMAEELKLTYGYSSEKEWLKTSAATKFNLKIEELKNSLK